MATRGERMKRHGYRMLLVYLMLIFIMPCNATGADIKEIAAKAYVVGPGDVLQIQVWDHDDLNRDVTVSQNGSFSFPFIGKINTTNRSVQDIENLLTRELGDGYIVAPQVIVSVLQYNYKKVFLFGEVLRPGSYPLQGDLHLLELISQAGGFTDDHGTICKIVRTKRKHQTSTPVSIEEANENEIITVDLYKLVSGHLNENIEIFPGDSIYINATDHIFVTGEVISPGEIKYLNGMTVRQAISIAGGGTATAAVNRTTIVRLKNGREVKIRPGLSDPVFPNDIIRVPESFF
jgi:polysaccharide export outer membrane protein